MTCLTGYPSSGKSTIAFSAIAKIHAADPEALALYCDPEWTLDKEYAAKCKVDLARLVVIHPITGESGYEKIEKLIKTGAFSIVVVDSIPAMKPKALLEGDYDEKQKIGLHATLTTQSVVRLNNISGQYDVHILWINHSFKDFKVNQYDPSGPQNMYTQKSMSGGQEFPYYMMHVIEVQKGESIMKDENIICNKIKFRVIKNKIDTPYRTCESVITYGIGLDRAAEDFFYGCEYGFIKKDGRGFEYNGTKKYKHDMIEWLRTQDLSALEEQIKEKLLESYGKSFDSTIDTQEGDNNE